MRGVFSGQKTLYIHANRYDQILESINFAFAQQIYNIVLVGASDALQVLDFLKQNNIPVLLQDVHRVPQRPSDDIDLPFKLPAILYRAGILVGLTYQTPFYSSQNLPFYAGTAAAFGLNKEEALQLVTSNTAKILGIDKRTGTIEVGKDANLVVSEGDILDVQTNRILHAFVLGEAIDLDGRQKRLYQSFMKRYEASGDLDPDTREQLDRAEK